MPEIAESEILRAYPFTPHFRASVNVRSVARIVHFLRRHLVGKKISKVQAPDDTVIFGKVGTTGPDFEAALKGKKVSDGALSSWWCLSKSSTLGRCSRKSRKIFLVRRLQLTYASI